MNVRGKCHCGNISFTLARTPDAPELAARACSCSFCVKHGGVWTSDPRGTLEIAIAQPALVSNYGFGTRTAEFHICTAAAWCRWSPAASTARFTPSSA